MFQQICFVHGVLGMKLHSRAYTSHAVTEHSPIVHASLEHRPLTPILRHKPHAAMRVRVLHSQEDTSLLEGRRLNPSMRAREEGNRDPYSWLQSTPPSLIPFSYASLPPPPPPPFSFPSLSPPRLPLFLPLILPLPKAVAWWSARSCQLHAWIQFAIILKFALHKRDCF